jgi:hypothetical protein
MAIKHVLFAFGIAFCAGIAAQAVQAMRTNASRIEPLGIVAALGVSVLAAFKEAAILWPLRRDLITTISTSHSLRHPALWMLIAALAALTLFALFRYRRRVGAPAQPD